MNSPKRILWIVGYIIALIGVCLIGVVATARYFRFIPELPFGIHTFLQKILLLPNDIQPIDQTVNKPRSNNAPLLSVISRRIDKEGTTIYFLRGRFTNSLTFKDDGIRGEFILDGDETKTPIMVFMTGTGGKMNIGQIQKSGSTWKLESASILESLLSQKPLTELHVYFSDLDKDEKRKVKLLFESLTKEGWTIPEGVAIAPREIGIITP